MKHKHWLIIYDICDSKRLKKVCDIVSCYGWRVQQSVFESIVDFEHIIIIKKRIEKVIQGNDFVAIVPLCNSDWQKIERYGIVQESIDHSQPFVIL